MHHLYVRLCKLLNINGNLLENFTVSLKLENLIGLKFIKKFGTTMTSQNNALWVEIHEKSREDTPRGKLVCIIIYLQ